jgi:hypothetical protein
MEYQGNNVDVGHIIGTNRKLVMSAKDRQTHLWLPGNTDTGKSKMLESMICQDIDKWRDNGKCGLMLLDLHGAVYRNVLKYVIEWRLDRPIIPLDLSRDDWILGYNPLTNSAEADPSVVVDELIAGISHVFGERDAQGTLRFRRVLSTVLHALLPLKRPFLEAFYLASNRAAVKLLSEMSGEPSTREGLKRIASHDPREFGIETESTLNRLSPFAENLRLKAMLGHVGESLDLAKVLADGAILLVNLEQKKNRLTLVQAKNIGTLLLTDLWTRARERGKPGDARDIKPFYLYIDECQNFVTPTIAQNLTEARGYGLNLILANQFPGQFLAAGENGDAMRRAMMQSARSKIVFQMTEDLPELALALFRGQLDPMMVKRFTTKVVGYKTEDITSRTTGTNYQEGGSDGAHQGRAVGRGQRQKRDDETDEPDIYESEQDVDGTSTVRTNVAGGNESETVTPTLTPIMGEEVAEFFRLDEQLAMFEQILHGQDKRECMARLVSMKTPIALRTIEVPPSSVSDTRLDAYLKKRFESLPFALRLPDAIAATRQREMDFMQTIIDLTKIDEPSMGQKGRLAKKVAVKVATKKMTESETPRQTEQ